MKKIEIVCGIVIGDKSMNRPMHTNIGVCLRRQRRQSIFSVHGGGGARNIRCYSPITNYYNNILCHQHNMRRQYPTSYIERNMYSGRRCLTTTSTQPLGDSNEEGETTQDHNKHRSSKMGLGLAGISMDELLALASCQPTALSLEAMYRYAPKRRNKNEQPNSTHHVDIGRLRNAQFLHKELPIRIAQRAVDLLTLPHGLNRTSEVQSVANTYLQYLQNLKDFPIPTNAAQEQEFTHVLNDFTLDRHSIPMAIAKGLQSLKDERKAPVDARRLAEMEEALNRCKCLCAYHVLIL